VLYGLSNGDPRSDVYSLAATLWHLLVGRSPFEQPGGDNSAYALMPRIRAVPVPPTGRADVPVSLERLLAHAMAKDPGSRPQTAIELARGLQSVEQEQRLPRTPVVVLDEQGRTAVAEGATVRPELDRDRTSVRTPASLAAPDPAPSRSATEPADVDDGPPTISGGVILAVVGVLVLGLVAALVWALGRDDTPQAQPSASVRPQTAPPTRAVDYPEQPAIDARPGPGSVTFTWNYVGAEEGDFFQLRVADNEAAVVDQGVTTVAGRPRHTVKAAAGDLVCAQVAVSRKSGLTSPRSAIRCQTAG
jgi:hypothetical protein